MRARALLLTRPRTRVRIPAPRVTEAPKPLIARLSAVARADGWAVLALAALVVWLFREALFGGGVFFKRDIHLVWHPQIEGFVRAIAAGSWPLWDPSPAFGQPLLADSGAQVLYPPTWLNLILRPWTYYTLFAFTHVLLSGLALYALARAWKLAPEGAALAALVWVLCGPFLSLVDLWHHFASGCWIPAVFLAADRAFERRRPREALILGLTLAGQILAGSADMCALTILALGGYVLMTRFGGRADGPLVRELLSTGSLALLVAAGLSAALWWPALDTLARSGRASFPDEMRTFWSVHPLMMLETLVPGLWGALPLKPEWRALLFDSRDPFLASLYLGLPALGLVTGAAAGPAHPARRFLLLLGGVGLLLALGRHAPFFDAAVFILRPLRILRYPVKAMVLVAFAWALLAGLGFEAWRGRGLGDPRSWRRLVVGSALVVVLVGGGLALWTRLEPEVWVDRFLALPPGAPVAPLVVAPVTRKLATAALLAALVAGLALLRGRVGGPGLALGLGALVLADLAFAHPRPNPVAPRALYTYRPEVLDALGDPGQARVYSYDYAVAGRSMRYLGREYAHALERLPQGWNAWAAGALGLQSSLAPQTAGRWRIRQSFEVDYRGLYPAALGQLTILLREMEETPAHLRLLQIGAVTHVLAMHTFGLADLEPVRVIPGLFADPLRVYRVPGTRPLTYAVGGARVATGVDALSALIDPTFDPAREIVIAQGPPVPASPSFAGTSRIEEARPDRVRLQAELNEAGFLVLVESYDPGWRATVDGRESPVLLANAVFRAVAVPAGRHVIELAYRPPAVLLGLGGSALTLLAVAISWLAGRRSLTPS